MAFALTKYIFPIEKVVLSESLGYVLDNPRSEKEIKIIRNFIEKTFIEKITESQTLKYRGMFHIFKILVNCASGRFSKFLTI